MYIINVPYENHMNKFKTTYLDENNGNFILLDDNTKISKENLMPIINEIEKYNYNVEIIDIKKIGINILDFLKKNNDLGEFDTVCLIGTGGKRMFSSMKNQSVFNAKKIINLKWSRVWKKDKSNKFVTNIDKFNFNNRKILLIEDVVASGETLYNIYKNIQKSGGEVIGVICALIQECSPLINKSFVTLYAGVKIINENYEGKDVYWYPPIYSLRHLLYGDREMPEFFKSIKSRYFNNEDILEKVIKLHRGKR